MERSSIFEQEWWLEIATRGRLEAIEQRWDDGSSGRLFYHCVRKRGMRKIALPPYTRLLGPQFWNRSSSKAGATSRKTGELIQRLPSVDSYHTVIRNQTEVILPFQLNDYKLSPKFTFLSPADEPIASVLTKMSQKQRNLVRSAEGCCIVKRHDDLERFLSLSRSRAGPDFNDYQVLSGLWEAAHARGQAFFLGAEGQGGSDLAGALLVADDKRAYFLVSARRSGADANKASAKVFFEGVALAKGRGLAFDADGFATSASAASLMKWGLPLSMNFNITRTSLPFELAKAVKDRVRPPPY